MGEMRKWVVASAIIASASAPANATETLDALVGSWEGKMFREARPALRVIQIEPVPEGVDCATLADGTIVGVAFSEEDERWYGVETSTKFRILTIKSGPYTFVYSPPSSPERAWVTHRSSRRGYSGRSKQVKLRAAEHTTCADALVIRRNAKVPGELTGAHPLIGNWHSLRSGGPEVRIEHVGRGGKTIGAACLPLRHGRVLLGRLEDRKIRARAIRGKDEIVWRRQPMRIGFKRGARYTLSLTGDDTAEISEVAPERTKRTVMLRGTRQRGCLARTAPGWHTQHGVPEEDLVRTDRVRTRREFEQNGR